MSRAPGRDPAAHVDTPSKPAVAENLPLQFGAPPPPPEQAKVFEPRPLSVGLHGQSIASLVISPDGAGVISVDFANHARLWPALDGSREPLAVPLSSPSEIVLNHDAEGFAVAALDSAGGLQILDVDGAGMLVAQTSLAADPPYAHVVTAGTGFVALRMDHQLDWIDRAGVRGAMLSPPHGERIARLLAGTDHVLALVETVEGLHGQWIDTTGGKLAWGETTQELAIDPERAFMSPDGKRIVAMKPKGERAVVIELATGAATTMKTRNRAAPSLFELDVEPPAPQASRFDQPGKLLGFATNDRIVFSDMFNGGAFAWYNVRGRLVTRLDDKIMWSVATDQSVFGGGKAVTFLDRELVVFTPAKATYLGYRTRAASGLTTTAAGPVARVGTMALLDDHLRIERHIDSGAVPIADDLALVRRGGAAGTDEIDEEWLEHAQPRRRKITRVALFDLATRKEIQSWPVASTARRMHYEPVTKRMVIVHGKTLELATFDPATRSFGASTKLSVPRTTDVVLLDPAQAGGDVMISVHGKELRRWRAEDVANATAPQPIALAVAPERIDRAGHVYMRDDAGAVVVSDRKREVRIGELKGWKLRPNADGTRIAVFRAPAVMMLDGNGKILWTIGMPGVQNLAWTAGGKLLAQARDLVELSPSDGSILYAQCGWTFGKRGAPNENFMPIGQTYCDL